MTVLMLQVMRSASSRASVDSKALQVTSLFFILSSDSRMPADNKHGWPELESPTPPELLKVLDNIAYAGEEVFLDFESLFKRLRDATNPHSRQPHPLLDDLYSTHVAFFQSAEDATAAWRDYLIPLEQAQSIAIDDSDSRIALEKVDERFEKLHTSVTETIECWKETAENLRKTLNTDLPTDWVLRAESFVFPSLPHSKRHALCTDLPNIAKSAEWHLDNFCHLSKSFQGILKQVETVRVGGAPGVDRYRYTARKTIPIALRLFDPLSFLFSLWEKEKSNFSTKILRPGKCSALLRAHSETRYARASAHSEYAQLQHKWNTKPHTPPQTTATRGAKVWDSGLRSDSAKVGISFGIGRGRGEIALRRRRQRATSPSPRCCRVCSATRGVWTAEPGLAERMWFEDEEKRRCAGNRKGGWGPGVEGMEINGCALGGRASDMVIHQLGEERAIRQRAKDPIFEQKKIPLAV
ncbi:hypothetical protein B0H19DRAFT_1069884 [Mycena capillaripes]|nr:hypothetical protein B0H19DRAFT_1069884 [Mycena capillaripes]